MFVPFCLHASSLLLRFCITSLQALRPACLNLIEIEPIETPTTAILFRADVKANLLLPVRMWSSKGQTPPLQLSQQTSSRSPLA
jgi:hypothetical protein